MRNILFATLLAGMAAAAVHAGQGAPADRAAVEKAIAAMEQKINDAFIKKDVAGMKANIADDAFAIDATGANPVAVFYKQLPAMNIKITDMKLSDFKYQWLDANNVVLTYTWSGKGTVEGQPVPSPTYGSTIYAKRGAAWKAVFHQETVAMAMPAAPAKPAAPAAPKK